jgi:hypothetical protein|tara:strand:+ start:3093 stop:3761 length:669 start_codon:yes stop_codon:yes gene_type:complete
MTTSGSKNFELQVDDYIEEAFERCGIEFRTGYDSRTAKRSLNLLLADWANRGLNQWTIKQRTLALTKGTASYDLSADVIDVLSAVCRRSGSDTVLNRISRQDYLVFPDKTQEGRPSQFFLDRQVTPKIFLYNAPENATDTIIYDALIRMDDADKLDNTLDMPFRFYPCLAAGLAYYVSIKRAPERVQLLKAIYDEEFERARSEDRDRSSFNIAPNYQYLRVN